VANIQHVLPVRRKAEKESGTIPGSEVAFGNIPMCEEDGVRRV